nr:MAG TPA: hypothetical protein [Caudoviricetes sp.]
MIDRPTHERYSAETRAGRRNRRRKGLKRYQKGVRSKTGY